MDISYSPLENFAMSIHSAQSTRSLYSSFANLRDSLPSSPHPLTPIQAVGMWLSHSFAQNPSPPVPTISDTSLRSAFAYKKVANKTRPVATTLPENFRITRLEHPNLLANMPPLPTNPPDFVPTERFTQARRDQMELGKGLLLPEEIKLAEWIICTHDTAFA